MDHLLRLRSGKLAWGPRGGLEGLERHPDREAPGLTLHSLAGLALFNAFLLGVGSGVLWGLRGWQAWGAFFRLIGVAYFLGVATLGLSLVLELVLGLEFSWVSLIVTGAVVAAAGVAAGRLQGHRPPTLRDAVRPRRRSLAAAAFAAVAVVYLEAMFRFARLHGLYSFDAWSFWVPKAKAIYFFGGLDRQFFTSLPGPSYPPLVPALEASSFHFMGGPDVVSLHVQFWVFFLGFVVAIAGLLSPRVPPLLLWPFLLLVLACPRIATYSAIAPQADFLLDYFFALAALLIAFWLIDREPWHLASATLFLAGAMVTKREGFLLASCVVVAALAVSWGDRSFAWLRLGSAAAAAFALSIPWRVWFTTHGLQGEGPEGGWGALLSHSARLAPSLRLALATTFDFERWLLVLPLALAAVALALGAGARRLPGYAAIVYGLALAGYTWVTWANVELPFTKNEATNPIVRLSGSLIFFSAAIAPLLLAAAWRGGKVESSLEESSS